ncbi:hypothetical protein [Pandoraea vervacti]|nr:hypothetical protein [Pandoraea vervacti]
MIACVSHVNAQTTVFDPSRYAGPTSPIVGAGGGDGARPVTPGVQPGLYVSVLEGAIAVTSSGSRGFTAGQFGFVPPTTTPPIILPQNPGLAFAPPPSPFSPPTAHNDTIPPPPVLVAPPITQLPGGSGGSGGARDPGPIVPSLPSGPTLPPPIVLQSGPGYTFMNWGSDGLASLGAGTATFDSQSALTKFANGAMPFVVNSAVTVTDAGKLDDLGWGRWTAGTVTDHGVPMDLSTRLAGMPFVVGKPTLDANLPVLGTMTYALVGATSAIDMVAGATGTVSGSLSIAYQNAQYNVTPNLTIAMPGRTYVTGAGSTTVGPDGARATFSTMTQNVTGGTCSGGACTFSTQGVLTGAAANNAGIVYSLSGSDVRVIGAAGFKR